MQNQNLDQILADLVAFQTVTGNREAALGCLDYTESYLAEKGMIIKRHDFNGFPSLVATTRETTQPKLLLQAHLDVVAGPDSCFALQEKKGKLYGRGVYDMKFAAAVFLKIVDELPEQLTDYDFGIMFTSDEEFGGKDGVKALLDAGYKTDVCLLPDGGDNWSLETSYKGCWIGRAVAEGTAAHGSRPWEGDNAIDRLIDALSDIRNIFEKQHTDSDTLSINKISGGSAINQVADKAEAVVDMRFTSNDRYVELYHEIESIAAEHETTLETIVHMPITETDMHNPYIQLFMKVAEHVHGRPLRRCRSLGVSDARFFAAKGIPVILLRPKGGSAHGDDEWIEQAGLEQYHRVIKAYIQEVCLERP